MMKNAWNYLRGKGSSVGGDDAAEAAAGNAIIAELAHNNKAVELLIAETSGQLLRNPTAIRHGRTYLGAGSSSSSSAVAADNSTTSCVATLSGHADRIWGLAWHPSGDLLVSCGGDKTAKLWIRREKKEASASVAAGNNSDDASSSSSSTSSYPYTWECVHTIRNEHAGTIRTAAWSADGTRLALCSFDGTISIWIVVLRKEVLLAKKLQRSAAVAADEEEKSDDDEADDDGDDDDEEDNTKSTADIHVELEITLDGHESEVKGVAWFTDEYNYSYENDRAVAVLKKQQMLGGVTTAEDTTASADNASAMSKLLATATSRVVAAASTTAAGGKVSTAANTSSHGVINARRPLQLATCSRDRSVWVWEGHSKEGSGASANTNNKAIAGSLLTLPAERDVEYECAGVLTGHPQDIKSVAWVPSAVLVGGNQNGPLVMLSSSEGDDQMNNEDPEDSSIANAATLAALPPAGPSASGALVSCSYDDTVRVWEEHAVRKDDWDCVQTLAGHDGTVWEAAVQPPAIVVEEVFEKSSSSTSNAVLRWKHALPTSSLVVTGSDDGRLVAWQRTAAGSSNNNKSNFVQVGSVGGFADGRTLYSVSFAPAVNVAAASAASEAAAEDTASSSSAATSLTSKFNVCISDVVAVGTGDDSFAVYRLAPNAAAAVSDNSSDTTTATAAAPIQSNSVSFNKVALVNHAHDSEVNCVRFCPTSLSAAGRVVELATASDDGDVRIWTVAL